MREVAPAFEGRHKTRAAWRRRASLPMTADLLTSPETGFERGSSTPTSPYAVAHAGAGAPARQPDRHCLPQARRPRDGTDGAASAIAIIQPGRRPACWRRAPRRATRRMVSRQWRRRTLRDDPSQATTDAGARARARAARLFPIRIPRSVGLPDPPRRRRVRAGRDRTGRQRPAPMEDFLSRLRGGLGDTRKRLRALQGQRPALARATGVVALPRAPRRPTGGGRHALSAWRRRLPRGRLHGSCLPPAGPACGPIAPPNRGRAASRCPFHLPAGAAFCLGSYRDMQRIGMQLLFVRAIWSPLPSHPA